MNARLILGYAANTLNDLLDSRRKHVYAADHDHIIAAAKNPAFQGHAVSAATARLTGNPTGPQPHQVAGAIAQQRRPDPAESGQDKFASLSGLRGGAFATIDHFRIKSGLYHVQDAGALRTFVSHRADLRHPVMIENSCSAPKFGNSGAHCRDAASRLTCHDKSPDRAVPYIDLRFVRSLGQMQGISRS